MALWNALDEIDAYYDGSDGLADDPAPITLPRRRVRVQRPNPDALTDAPTNVALADKAREALHGDPIRAHERQMALVAAGDPQAVAIAAACALWLAARAAEEASK